MLEEYMSSGRLYQDLVRSRYKQYPEDILLAEDGIDRFLNASHKWEVLKQAIGTVPFEGVSQRVFEITYGREVLLQEAISSLAPEFKHSLIGYPLQLHIASKILGYMHGSFFTLGKNNSQYYLVSKYKLTPEEEDAAKFRRYIPPMLTKPRDWISNKEGGYESITKSIILGGRLNHHDEYQALDAINLLQSIEWHLDPYIASMELEANKEDFETQDELIQWMKFKDDAEAVIGEYKGRKFYFVWRYDKRGRQYMQGYHINLQSIKYLKAVLTFGDAYKLTGEL